jgi:hypothetical protein
MLAAFRSPCKVLVEKGCDIIELELTIGEKTSFTALGAISGRVRNYAFGCSLKAEWFIKNRNLGYIQLQSYDILKVDEP